MKGTIDSQRDGKEVLYIIRQLGEMVSKLGYKLSLEDRRILAEKIIDRCEVGDGILKI